MLLGNRLDLNNELLEGLKTEIEVSLNTALMLADKEGKEVEVGLKIKVSTETEREFKEGRVAKEWTEPRLSWVVTRKVKENKIDHKGSLKPGYELRFDDDGKPYVIEVNQQASMFDNEQQSPTIIHYHFGEKQVNEDANRSDTSTTTLDGDEGDSEDPEEGLDSTEETEVSKGEK